VECALDSLDRDFRVMQASRIYSADAASARGDVPIAVGGLSTPARLRAAFAWVESQALFIAGVGALAALILRTAPSHINQDGWLALVGGRYVALHGIPQHDTMAVITHGARWIDQQWLSQLAIYGLHQLGGMPLYVIVCVGLTVAALVMAITAARRLGGDSAHVIWVLPLAAFLYFAGSVQVRTQGFAYPFFVAVLWLLVTEARATSRRRVYLVLPLLILWGNLHGSVVVGVGMTMLYGASLIVEDLRAGRPLHMRRRGLVFLVAAPLCLLATPYGLAGVTYYRETLMNPAFKTLITEWQPITAVTGVAVPFFIAAFAIVWLLGQVRGRLRLFEALTLLFLTAAAISAIRNITWFALAAIVLVPPLVSSTRPRRAAAPRRPALNLALVAAVTVFVLAAIANVATKPAGWFESGYDGRALRQVAALTHQRPNLLVYADGHFADWLLWHDPSLAGRIAYDSRLELLTASQLRDLAEVAQDPLPGGRDVLAGYRLFVLDTKDSEVYRRLLRRSGAGVVLRGHQVAVALHGA
jgi:MFS family permease